MIAYDSLSAASDGSGSFILIQWHYPPQTDFNHSLTLPTPRISAKSFKSRCKRGHLRLVFINDCFNFHIFYSLLN